MFKRLSSKTVSEDITGGVASHPRAPSCSAALSPMGYVEEFAKARTTRESRYQHLLVTEVAHARHNHRHPLFICGFDNFGITNRAARLNDCRDPRLGGGI